MESLPQKNMARDGAVRMNDAPDCGAAPPPFAAAEAANDTRISQLARTIEQEIIPRLMLAHRVGPASFLQAPAISRDDVRHFVELTLAPEDDMARAAVQAHRSRGVAIEAIYLDLLAPAARHLGDLWTEDLCTFTDVTIALGRLHRVLRELSPTFGCKSSALPVRRVMLLPTPGEQHTFGLVMVGEFFRRANWDVVVGGWGSGPDPLLMAAAEWFDAIGFSLGAAVRLTALAESVRLVRHASCNSAVAILVGGPLFRDHPEYLADVGGDGMTIDGREAPALAEHLIAENTPHARPTNAVVGARQQ